MIILFICSSISSDIIITIIYEAFMGAEDGDGEGAAEEEGEGGEGEEDGEDCIILYYYIILYHIWFYDILYVIAYDIVYYTRMI